MVGLTIRLLVTYIEMTLASTFFLHVLDASSAFCASLVIIACGLFSQIPHIFFIAQFRRTGTYVVLLARFSHTVLPISKH